MIIDAYSVTAASQHSYQKTEATVLRVNSSKASLRALSVQTEQRDSLEIAQWVKETNEETAEKNKQTLQKDGIYSPKKLQSGVERLPQTPLELKSVTLQMLLEALTGHKFKANPLSLQLSGQAAGAQAAGSPQNVSAPLIRSEAFFSLQQVVSESESVSYSAKGMVKTADGKTISFDINMSMSREFLSYTEISAGKMNLVDPLVINYGGTAASLTGEKFDFDLTCDGKKESISFAGQGSGFLALDRNNDGKINDGSELFGPSSGSGFEELRQYDSDGNSWIDEADSIFKDLRVWSKDKDGKDQLFTLTELGIGAIFLGETQTQFSMSDDAGNAAGQMRSTSFFLKENGGAGTISHIDLLA